MQLTLYNHYTLKRNVLRTVHAQLADRLQYNSADPTEPTTFLDKLQNYRADCPLQNSGPSAVQLRKTTRGNDASGQILNSTADRPALLGGPSAVHSANPPETTTSLDKFLDSTADSPLSNSGPSAVQLCRPTRTNYPSGQISNLYGGLSALKQRTVHSLTLQNHQR